MNIDHEMLAEAIKNQAKQGLTNFLNGAADDIEAFSAEISIDMTEAIAAGDTEAIDEMKAQWRALAEKHRVYGSRQAWGVFSSILGGAGQLAVVAIRAAAVGL